MTGFGIPYGDSAIDGDGYHVVCPVCDRHCYPPEGTERGEDEITKGAALAYADHYEEWHGEGE